ncbi:MAG: hypothetical protein KAI81_05875 [Candidatus Marinimicrobia bacterium]|nr:hypothetical protein [Candidatus Neomarinimicrobiota bacterium]
MLFISGNLFALDVNDLKSAEKLANATSDINFLLFPKQAHVIFQGSNLHSDLYRNMSGHINLPYQKSYYFTGSMGYKELEKRSLTSLSIGFYYVGGDRDSSDMNTFAGISKTATDHELFRVRNINFIGGVLKSSKNYQLSSAIVLDYTLGSVRDLDEEIDVWSPGLISSIQRDKIYFSIKLNRIGIIYALGWGVEL